VCHPAERAQFERSPHAREDVHCVSCHRGNDQSLELAVAHGSGFRGRPARRDIPALCASCHADESRMRPYNLPVDQFALYQTSGHGRRLAAGDTRVAVCSDCHGAHEILPPADPASSVFALNIPRTCGRCHGDRTLAVGVKDGKTILEQYLSSVHARELVERGNLRAPSCVSCHGVHGAAPPAVGDVDKVCGQCHTAERRFFIAGPHHQGLERAGLPQCASCHGDHAIAAVRPERLATLCAECHSAGSAEEHLGNQLWTEYRAAAAEVDRAAALTARAEAVPLNTDDYRARLEEARTYLSEALPAAHAVREDVTAAFALRARSVSREIESEIHAKLNNVRTRRIVLVVFWFYLLLTILILRGFKRGEAKS
jgi:predicted CXXCH cytochrome family protein